MYKQFIFCISSSVSTTPLAWSMTLIGMAVVAVPDTVADAVVVILADSAIEVVVVLMVVLVVGENAVSVIPQALYDLRIQPSQGDLEPLPSLAPVW